MGDFLKFVLTTALSFLLWVIFHDLTVAFSLLSWLILDKLLSAVPIKHLSEKLGVRPETSDVESEKTTGFVKKHVDNDELNLYYTQNMFPFQECGTESSGSPRKRENEKKSRGIEDISFIDSYIEENMFDESPERARYGEMEINLDADEAVCKKYDEYGVKGVIDEDDWEGVERTELERAFGAAVVYVESESRRASLYNDLKIQLYGLHKIATQGACSEPQPMALKLSARAKWNSWQQLGNMSPEAAMERYIHLVSENIPSWSPDNAIVHSRHEFLHNLAPQELQAQSESVEGRKLEELNHCVQTQ